MSRRRRLALHTVFAGIMGAFGVAAALVELDRVRAARHQVATLEALRDGLEAGGARPTLQSRRVDVAEVVLTIASALGWVWVAATCGLLFYFGLRALLG